MDRAQEIICTEIPGAGGHIGQILLNRPKALNALSFHMCEVISKQLAQWEIDPKIKAVIIKGTGRAFCAGGDIRHLYNQKKSHPVEEIIQFFWQEYSMNARLFHFPKPYIAFLDGITMGGGAGISVHGSHQIATEKFIFAMPEATIGFFTDIGAGHFLNRCPHYFGHYLALTSAKINAADARALRIISHTIPEQYLSQVEETIIATAFTGDAFATVSDILNHFQQPVAETVVWEHRQLIEKCFSQPSVEKISLALNEQNNEFSQHALQQMQQRSPTSLKVIFEYLHRAKNLSFNDLMKMEFDMVQHFLNGHDFDEGIRAALIDKDQQPKWQPSDISKVDEKIVTSYFQPLSKRLSLTE